MKLQPILPIALAAAAVSCSPVAETYTRAPGPSARAAPQPSRSVSSQSGFWRGEGVSGSPRIKISLSEQQAYFYKGDQLVGQSPVATGRAGHRTPAGSYRISQKIRHHRSHAYGSFVDASGNVVKSGVDVRSDKAPPGTRFKAAPMPYFLRFNNRIGMHAGPLPGYPASAGCVRLPSHLASQFYHNSSHGTPVVVVH